MKQPCTALLKRAYVPQQNTPAAFNLDKYIEKDNSMEKNKAAAWGAGDFKALIKLNDKTIKPEENKPKKAYKAPQGRPLKKLSKEGERILLLLKLNDKSAVGTAKALGMSPQTMAAAMHADKHCSMETYERIAKYFDVSVEWLTTGKVKQ